MNDAPTSRTSDNPAPHDRNADEAKFAPIFNALSAAGITAVLVRFDGEGDNGQIDGIEAYRDGRIVPLPAAVIHQKTEEREGAPPPLAEEIESLCYDLLGYEHDGWENDDGAFGEFFFDVIERKVTLTFNARFTDVSTSIHSF